MVYGFILMFINLLKDYWFDSVVVVFDWGEFMFCYEVLFSYKV